MLRFVLLALAAAVIIGSQGSSRAQMVVGASGLPIPRFVSIDTDKAYMRRGPGTRFAIEWVYQRDGWPLEVVQEYGHWRRLRDRDGTVGWMHRQLLSGKRTGVINVARTTLYEEPNPDAPEVAFLEDGVLGRLLQCQAEWCRMQVGEVEGWVRRDDLWGLLPGESFE